MGELLERQQRGYFDCFIAAVGALTGRQRIRKPKREEEVGHSGPADTSRLEWEAWVRDRRAQILLNPERLLDEVERFQSGLDVPPATPSPWNSLLERVGEWYSGDLTDDDSVELADERSVLARRPVRLASRSQLNPYAVHREPNTARSKYLVEDVVRQKDIRDWGSRVARLARAAGYPEEMIAELLYERLDPRFRVSVPSPDPTVSYVEFLAYLHKRQPGWYSNATEGEWSYMVRSVDGSSQSFGHREASRIPYRSSSRPALRQTLSRETTQRRTPLRGGTTEYTPNQSSRSLSTACPTSRHGQRLLTNAVSRGQPGRSRWKADEIPQAKDRFPERSNSGPWPGSSPWKMSNEIPKAKDRFPERSAFGPRRLRFFSTARTAAIRVRWTLTTQRRSPC